LINLPPEISQNLLKKIVSLSRTLFLFMVLSPVGLNLDTAGNIFEISEPAVGI